MTNHRVTLIGREGCHLCDNARLVVSSVLEQLRDAPGVRTLEDLSIDDDVELRDAYWDQIPVVLIDGKIHNFWTIDPARLSDALSA